MIKQVKALINLAGKYQPKLIRVVVGPTHCFNRPLRTRSPDKSPQNSKI